MFCKNCGIEVQDGTRFCPGCGAELSQTITPTVESDVQPVAAFDNNEQPKKNKKTGKLIAIISSAVVLVAAIVAVVVMFVNSKGYEKKVENYLDFYATHETDVEKFLVDGNTSQLGTDEEIEAYSIAFDAMLDEEDSGSYYYGESLDYDNYEEYIEDHIDRLYESMDKRFGDDWELTYEIKSSKEVSNKKIKELKREFRDYHEDLEEAWEDYDYSSDDEEIIEEYLESLSDVEIEEAYEVKVKIEIDGDDASLKDTYKFVVADIDGNWVIMEGPSIYSFIYAAEK